MMFPKTILTVLTIGLAAFGAASPLDKRATTVSSDTGSVSIAGAVTAGGVSFPDDIGGSADAVGAVAEVVQKVVRLIQGLVDGDIKRRQRFTQETVTAVYKKFPTKTVVMSNVGYSLSCQPTVVQRTSYKAKVGSNVSYDVLVFGKGCTFTLKGDGGFENWAYIRQSSCRANGKTITC
ncbi:hypothetical protein ONS95_002011 [Cadophora gregata]|uniref:uncharacterized protein n=1 Tax=Cadophora gregata TaxID=51156 RepID=UPI0026DD2F8B|nr:uncharacterized protein ONS95_002011 [Cadophora gregata]KAK0111666.1 hypothetical protein ONS95_002011 [Cadophora gregata]KAK0111857.1 hypothetical protein ONS96_001125 [Cadophora gregata f. sp. sojae]